MGCRGINHALVQGTDGLDLHSLGMQDRSKELVWVGGGGDAWERVWWLIVG